MATTSRTTARSGRGTLPVPLQQEAIATASFVSSEQREAITGAIARARRIPNIRNPLTIEKLVAGINTFATGLSYHDHRFKKAVQFDAQTARIYFNDPDKHEIFMDFTLETLPAPFEVKKTTS